ncbi:MAG: hypothetical protein JXA92_05730 [candidate division Zixibacteria bacterium]|nr:hypothetical protein [candidate division Zixibacteria bacterium]
MEKVLKHQGIPENTAPSEKIIEVFNTSREHFRRLGEPRGIWVEISKEAFAEVYRGEGHNDSTTPVADIFPYAGKLALFAVTLGEAVSLKINSLMAEYDFAGGSMLDSVASEGAELAADYLQESFMNDYLKKANPGSEIKILRYSPGYCGWHISGQKKLFGYLNPEKIKMSFNDRYLMSPLKSITGVMIAARKEKHYFEMIYPCCGSCRTPSCRERLTELERE